MLLARVFPVRKPQQLFWGRWKYLQKQEHQLLFEGGVKALPFQTGFTQDVVGLGRQLLQLDRWHLS